MVRANQTYPFFICFTFAICLISFKQAHAVPFNIHLDGSLLGEPHSGKVPLHYSKPYGSQAIRVITAGIAGACAPLLLSEESNLTHTALFAGAAMVVAAATNRYGQSERRVMIDHSLVQAEDPMVLEVLQSLLQYRAAVIAKTGEVIERPKLHLYGCFRSAPPQSRQLPTALLYSAKATTADGRTVQLSDLAPIGKRQHP